MKLQKIELYNFRNYKTETIEFDEGLNVIVGKNAQGKTNLLEAIYFCAVGKSFRATREREVINMDSDIAKIKVYIQKEIGQKVIEIIFSKSQKKTIKIDGIPISKIGELMGELNAVFFAPNELKMIKESPEDRRRFIDIDISQTSKEYFYLLTKYNKLLQSRNMVLKQQIDFAEKVKMLNIYDRQLATINLKLAKFRQNFITNITPYAIKVHEYLTDNNEILTIEYVGIKEKTEQEILDKFKENYEKDIRLGYTTYGIHRDDIKICIGDIDVRTYGSQGQQRTVALSLKLAELEIMKQTTKAVPILLLDDVLSELDEKRRTKLLKFCSKAQTFITCTEFEYNLPHKDIVISSGKKIN